MSDNSKFDYPEDNPIAEFARQIEEGATGPVIDWKTPPRAEDLIEVTDNPDDDTWVRCFGCGHHWWLDFEPDACVCPHPSTTDAEIRWGKRR